MSEIRGDETKWAYLELRRLLLLWLLWIASWLSLRVRRRQCESSGGAGREN